MRNLLNKVLSLLLILPFFMGIHFAKANTTEIWWSDIQKETYNDLYAYTFLWSGDPYDDPRIKGLNLKTMQITSNKNDIDIVMNQYGSMAANGILGLNENLDDPTDEKKLTSFQSSMTMTAGSVYLIVTSDGDYAKIKIDSILPTKVNFSYVLASEISEEVDDDDFGFDQDPIYDESEDDVYYELEEGNVSVSVVSEPGDAYYELYRSDNGGQFVKLTDFPINEPYFEDKYALAGHTYVYYFDIFDNYDQKIASSVNIHVNVLKGKTNNTTPSKPSTSNSSSIKLKLNSKSSTVNGVTKTLDVPPTTVDGRTLVPIRFISEALGADVKWNDKDSSIAITYNGKTILLTLNKSEAKINGKSAFLDVPAQTISNRTMVPIRFISENLDQDITFDKNTYEIEIKGKGQSKGSTSSSNTNNQNNSTSSKATNSPTSEANPLTGIWSLWVPGGYSKIDMATEYVHGAGYDGLIIYPDGTYMWMETSGDTLEGLWSSDGSEIIVHQGKYGWEWNVKAHQWPDVNGIMVYVLGTYYEGRSIGN